MKAGDFCSNWTGDGQVHPLDPGANVLHTEGLYNNKKEDDHDQDYSTHGSAARHG